MQELTFDEVESVSGGIGAAVVVVGAIAAVAFGIGVYNGYQEEKAKKVTKAK